MLFGLLKTVAGKAMSLNGNGLMYLVLGFIVVTMASSGLGKLSNAFGFTKSKEELSYDIATLKTELETAVKANESLVALLKKEKQSSKIDLEAVNKVNTNNILIDKQKRESEKKRIESVASLIDTNNSGMVSRGNSNNYTIPKPERKINTNKTITKLDAKVTYQEKIVAKLAKQIEVNSITDSGIEVITIDKEKMQKVSYINISSIWDTYTSLDMETTTSV